MFDLGEDEGTHFITMEYVAGDYLKRHISHTQPEFQLRVREAAH